MPGWFSGSPRQVISRALSCMASASAYLPSLLYVIARLFMAVPARHKKTHALTINKAHAAHHSSTHAPHQCQDGSQAARDDRTPARFPRPQAHLHTFQGLRTSQQESQWRRLHVDIKQKVSPHNEQITYNTSLHSCPYICQDGSRAASGA